MGTQFGIAASVFMLANTMGLLFVVRSNSLHAILATPLRPLVLLAASALGGAGMFVGSRLYPMWPYRRLVHLAPLLHLCVFFAVSAFFLNWVPLVCLHFCWFVGINCYALLAMHDDKLRAATGKQRLPEVDVKNVALMGGALGLLLGISAFSHKMRAFGFRRDVKRMGFLASALSFLLPLVVLVVAVVLQGD